MTQAIVPKSDQLNSEDLLAGPVTVTIVDVRAGNTEQPVVIDLVEFPGRPFKPSKTVSRILVAAWGRDSSAYVGRKLTLFRDPTVKWAGEAVGGIRLEAMSHIDRALEVSLTVTRGRKTPHRIQPLRERDWAAELTQAGTNPDALLALGKAAKDANAPADTLGRIRAAYNAATRTNSGAEGGEERG